MALHDGNGWVQCRCGLRHWGLHGAAGLLVMDASDGEPGEPGEPDEPGEPGEPGAQGPAGVRVLLQLRADWTHVGGTWGLPGGARDSHENVVEAALREAEEEVGVAGGDVDVLAEVLGVDHGDWSYTYVLAVSRARLELQIRTTETDELRWVRLDAVTDLPLHPGLATSWPQLREAVERTAAGRL